MPVVERLEDRRLFAVDTIQPLPFSLDFSSTRGELVDKDGQGTGFTRVQQNKLGTGHTASLLDLDTTAGVLRVTTTGIHADARDDEDDDDDGLRSERRFTRSTTDFSPSQPSAESRQQR